MSASPPDFSAPHRLAMGLAALEPEESWIEIDGELAADLALKRQLLEARRAQVFVAVPDSHAAQTEVRDHLVHHLLRAHPEQYGREGRALFVPALGEAVGLDAGPPLAQAARLVQEDLCVMERSDGAWRLTAGAVCFPTRWDLPSMLGRPLTDIHGRVPGYREQLAHSANRFFDGMVAGRVFRRKNWSLVDDPALFQPTGKLRRERNAAIDAANAGDSVWLRAEHQTLQRLPASGAVLFTIRVHRTPLRVIAAAPGRAHALAASLRSMSADFLLYKSFPPIRDAVLAYLDRAGARGERPGRAHPRSSWTGAGGV